MLDWGKVQSWKERKILRSAHSILVKSMTEADLNFFYTCFWSLWRWREQLLWSSPCPTNIFKLQVGHILASSEQYRCLIILSRRPGSASTNYWNELCGCHKTWRTPPSQHYRQCLQRRCQLPQQPQKRLKAVRKHAPIVVRYAKTAFGKLKLTV